MKKVMAVGVLLFILIGLFVLCVGIRVSGSAVFTKSDYIIVKPSNVEILPTGGEQTTLSVTVTPSGVWTPTPGLLVHCIFEEMWEGELASFGKTQSVYTNESGVAVFPVPTSSWDGFRYASLWVQGDTAGVVHQMFWYTGNTNKPAKIIPVDVVSELYLGEERGFLYQVLNAWGEALANVSVSVIDGNGYVTSPQTAVSDSSGYVEFYIKAPSNSVGSTELRVQINAWGFIQTAMIVQWQKHYTPPPTPTCADGIQYCTNQTDCEAWGHYWYNNTCNANPAPPPSPTCADGIQYCTNQTDCEAWGHYWYNNTCNSSPQPTKEVAYIEAVNPSSYENGVPTFISPIGSSVTMKFVAYDASGQPVSGVSLTVLYPSTTVSTGSNGQVSITSPTSQFEGWDDTKIWVTSNESVYLNFKIVYE